MKEMWPIPGHFKEEKAGELWSVPYQEIAGLSRKWAKEHGIRPAYKDEYRICLLLIDMQITFCIPGFELFVGGRSGRGAVDDTIRICKFIYQNLNVITQIILTMDTHQAFQIFHDIALIDNEGNHPQPFSLISEEDIAKGKWRLSDSFKNQLGLNNEDAKEYLRHYVRELAKEGKYQFTIWPYHAMLGGIGHAIVPAIEEAVFFHAISRESQPIFEIKGNLPLTENYSVLGPEVIHDHKGNKVGKKNTELIDRLLSYDVIIIAGEAKSHCVAWTVNDLLNEINSRDPSLAGKVYLLEDCTSPVVVPGAMDYTDEADSAYNRFSQSGMHVVKSTIPISEWTGINIKEEGER